MARRKVRKKLSLPKGIDSKLELDLSRTGLKGCNWKPMGIGYTMSKTYHPDAEYDDILIEVKGYFRNSAEAGKYLHVKEQYPNKELVFVFANPDKPIPWAKRRKDGSRMTHAEWADSKGFRYYSPHNLPKEWGIKK